MAESPVFIPRELSADELVSVIFNYSGRIASARDIDEILIEMNNLAKQLVVADRCTLWLADQDRSIFWTRVLHGNSGRIEIPMHTGMVGEAYRRSEVILIDDAYQSPFFNAEIDHQTGYKTTSALMVPVYGAQGQLMGIYQAINKFKSSENSREVLPFSTSDAERLSLAANFFGKSLASQLLFEEVDKTQRDLLHIMGEVAESRSRETGNHVLRVGELSWLLAKAKGLPHDECEMIRLAAPLHDIGKVAITDLILNKPSKLTEEEFEIMKTHAQIGEELLAKSPRRILRAGSLIAGQHQEKFDGSGYPRGLRGRAEEREGGIHLYGRICAIADVFDALAHDRCYKKAWPLEQVKSFFAEQSGKHFDPELVELMFDQWEEFLHVHEKYKDVFEEV